MKKQVCAYVLCASLLLNTLAPAVPAFAAAGAETGYSGETAEKTEENDAVEGQEEQGAETASDSDAKEPENPAAEEDEEEAELASDSDAKKTEDEAAQEELLINDLEVQETGELEALATAANAWQETEIDTLKLPSWEIVPEEITFDEEEVISRGVPGEEDEVIIRVTPVHMKDKDELSEEERQIYDALVDYLQRMKESGALEVSISLGDLCSFAADADLVPGESDEDLQALADEAGKDWNDAFQDAFTCFYWDYQEYLWFDRLVILREASASFSDDSEEVIWTVSYRIGIPTEFSIEEVRSLISGLNLYLSDAQNTWDALKDMELYNTKDDGETVGKLSDLSGEINVLLFGHFSDSYSQTMLNTMDGMMPEESAGRINILYLDINEAVSWQDVNDLADAGDYRYVNVYKNPDDDSYYSTYFWKKAYGSLFEGSGTVWLPFAVIFDENQEVVYYCEDKKAASFTDVMEELLTLAPDLEFDYVPVADLYNYNKANIDQERTDDAAGLYYSWLDPEDYPLTTAKAEEITSGLTTDEEKAKALYQWVAENVYYDYEHLDDLQNVVWLPEEMLAMDEPIRSVCQGYAELYCALCRAVGVPCKRIRGYATSNWSREIFESSATNHAWDEVYLDGEWKHADPTWDSGNKYKEDGTTVVKGDMNWNYYQISLEDFSKDHKIMEYEDNNIPTQGQYVFTKRMYTTILEREPDREGQLSWMKRLYAGTATGASCVDRFVLGKELTEKNVTDETFLSLIYQAVLGRTPDSGGKKAWTERMDSGVSREYVVKGFTDSTEFSNLCSQYEITRGTLTLTQNRDQNIKVTAFVNRCYQQALDRKGEEAGLNSWTGMILTKQKTPQQVALRFAISDEMTKKNLSNEEYVKTMYRLYMGREADSSGLSTWTGQLSRNNYTRRGLAERFGKSTEFKKIVSGYGL